MSKIKMSPEKISDIEMRSDLQFFRKKDPAVQSMLNAGHKTLCKIVEDKGDEKIHWFFHVENNKEFSYLIKYQPDSYYEVLQEGQPQYLYADLDGKFKCDESKERNIIDSFLKVVKKCFEKNLKEEFNVNNCKFTKNHRGDKFSVHFCYKGKTFSSETQQKTFWSIVLEEIENDKNIKKDLSCIHEDKTGKITPQLVIDMGVYNKNRSMRTILSHKEEGDKPLEPYEWIQIGDTKGYFVKLEKFEITDFLIHQPDSKTPYKLSYKKKDKPNTKTVNFNRQEIEKRLEEKHPDMMISGPNQLGFCITRKPNHKSFKCICGDNHEKNNAAIILKDDGSSIFYCYNSGEKQPFIELEVKNKDIEYYWDDYDSLNLDGEIMTEQELINFCDGAFQFFKNGKEPLYRKRNINYKGIIEYSELQTKNITIFSKKLLNFQIGKTAVNNLQDCIWYLISNKKIKTYSGFVHIPYGLHPPKISSNFVNTFDPFSFIKYKPETVVDFKTTKLYYHFKNVISNNDPATLKYLSQYFGDQLQNPQLTSDNRAVCIIFKGDEGDGKDMFMKAVRRCLDDKKNCVLIGTGKKLFAEFTGVFINKLLVVISETDEKSEFRKNAEAFKTLIAAESHVYNKKNVDETNLSLDHRTKYVITTNNDNAMQYGRRSCFLKVNNCMNGNREYFSDLAREVLNDDVIKSFFDYLFNFDLSDYVSDDYPKTEYSIETKENQLSNFIKFLIEFLRERQEEEEESYSYDTVRNMYSDYCNNNKMVRYSDIKIGKELTKLNIKKERKTEPCSKKKFFQLTFNRKTIKTEIDKVYKLDIDLTYR